MIARSPLDNLFLLLESSSTPMHVGALVPLTGEVDTARLRRVLLNRCARQPTLRLVPGQAQWQTVGTLHTGKHIEVTEVENGDAMRRFASMRMASALAAGRPAWHIDIIRQADSGRTALFLRLHHALADGVGASRLLRALSDQPAARHREPTRADMPAPQRSAVERGLGVLRATARQLVALPSWRAPATPFNRRIGCERQLAWTRLPRHEVYETARRLNASPNDVVVAACSGGLRTYLQQQDALPGDSLVAALPISLRLHGLPARGANRVSGMACTLGTDMADPLQRLRSIRRQTWRARRHEFRDDPQALMDLASLLPAPVVTAAAAALAVTPLAERLRAVFNLIITHVPGTSARLSLAGSPIEAAYPFTPLFHGLGLVIAVFGCGEFLDVGLTGSMATTPALATLADGIGVAGHNLWELATDAAHGQGPRPHAR